MTTGRGALDDGQPPSAQVEVPPCSSPTHQVVSPTLIADSHHRELRAPSPAPHLHRNALQRAHTAAQRKQYKQQCIAGAHLCVAAHRVAEVWERQRLCVHCGGHMQLHTPSGFLPSRASLARL